MHNCSYDRLETLPSGALADEIERRGGRVIWEPDDITSVLDWLSNFGMSPWETLPSGALADEIERRGGRVIWEPDDITSVLDWLSNFGVPPEVLEPLERWASEPVVDRRRLDAWLLACRASTGAEAADAQA